MGLPKVEHATFFDKLPSTKKQFSYRPFRVVEEKLFLLSTQSAENDEQKVELIRDLVDACTFGKLNLSTLETFDIEYVFTRIYSKSRGEIITLNFRCTEKGEDGTECGKNSTCALNLANSDVDFPEGFSKKIVLDESRMLGVVMKHVGFDEMKRVAETAKARKDATDREKIRMAFQLVADNIECVFEREEVYEVKDFPPEELMTFLEALTAEQFDKIEEHFSNYPKLKGKVDYVCACGKVRSQYQIEGILNFLD